MEAKEKKLVIFLLVLVQILFGVNFVASKIIVGNIDPVHWAFLRFLASGLFLILFGFFRYPGKSGSGSKYFSKIFILSFLGVTISQLGLLKGIKLTTSINTSIITSTIPIWTLIIVTIKGQEKFNLWKGVGFFLSFCGVALIRKIGDFSFSNTTFIGDLLVLGGAMATAIFLSYSKKFLSDYNHLWSTSWLFLFGAFQIFIISLIEGNEMIIPALNLELSISMIFSAFGATLLTYFLSNWALTKIESGHVAIFIYLQPIVASIVAYEYLGEEITIRTILSGALIVIGLIFALTLGSKKTIVAEGL